LIDVYGPDITFGYDISCTHLVTVLQSSIGEKAKQSRLRFFVEAFHGYAHNRRCQIHYHPCFLTSAGLEDFETCEWIFSQENQCAHLFQHGSAFHRHLTLDWFYQTWDPDHHTVLGDYLFQNYRKALKIIRTEGATVTALLQMLNLMTDDLLKFQRDEEEFFERLEREPMVDEKAYEYLDVLKLLDKVWCVGPGFLTKKRVFISRQGRACSE
ncbi:hypothetical protein DACRYDRAFT_58151, partial [Dacryopinax primogenitus]